MVRRPRCICRDVFDIRSYNIAFVVLEVPRGLFSKSADLCVAVMGVYAEVKMKRAKAEPCRLKGSFLAQSARGRGGGPDHTAENGVVGLQTVPAYIGGANSLKLHANPPKPPDAALEPHCVARTLGSGIGETEEDNEVADCGGLRYGPEQ